MPDRKDYVENVAPRASSANAHDVVLQRRITERLQSSPTIDASDVSVVVQNRSVTLFGSAPSEAQRGLIQALALGISGVIEVRNRLKVAGSTH